MVTPPLAGFILYERREEVTRMLAAIGRAFRRFWNGPWVTPEDDSERPRYKFRDPRPEHQILAERDYWRREYDEDDEQHRDDAYTL